MIQKSRQKQQKGGLTLQTTEESVAICDRENTSAIFEH
jgi:hypothetical protein